MENRVRRWTNWGISVSKPSQIRSDDTVAMVSQKINLMAPWIPNFREAMEKQNKRSFSFFNYMHPYTIRFDPLMIHIHHHHSVHHFSPNFFKLRSASCLLAMECCCTNVSVKVLCWDLGNRAVEEGIKTQSQQKKSRFYELNSNQSSSSLSWFFLFLKFVDLDQSSIDGRKVDWEISSTGRDRIS